MIEADVSDIYLIQEAVQAYCQTVKQTDFTCGPSICSSYGSKTSHIDLGHAFQYLNFGEQVYALLRAAIQHTPMPERHKLSAAQREFTDPAAIWIEYIIDLLQLLPERPFLITGTPYDQDSIPRDETGEPIDDGDSDLEGDNDGIEENNSGVEARNRGVVRRIINFFSRNQPSSP